MPEVVQPRHRIRDLHMLVKRILNLEGNELLYILVMWVLSRLAIVISMQLIAPALYPGFLTKA